MSESEEEISLSGSDSEEAAAEEIDNEEMIIEDEPPTSDVDDAMSESQSNRSQFQKEFWQHRFLPYYSGLEAQANRYLSEIKAGLAHSIVLNDPQVGFIHWTLELERYIDLYGKRFSKEDHVNFVKIYLPFVVKGSIWRNTKISMHALNMLIGKRDYLIRGDLVIDWRPLYELYIEVAYKNLEEDGIFLMPEGFKSELYTLIFYARNYFSDTATQELLDELRPLICIWDESIIRAWKLLDLFLPMNMALDLHPTIGSGLWFEEAWHWYTVPENNSLIDPNILKLFSRLSYECPNLIDWTPKLDIIFTKMIRSLHLGKLNGMSQSLSFEQFTMFITYMLGSKCHDAVIGHLKSVLDLIQDFLHPSNHGDHSQYLLSFIQKFSHNVVLRIKRERNEKSNKPRTTNRIPAEMRLTQKHLDDIAELFVPSLKLAIFTKVRNEFVSPIYKNFGSFSPKIIIPAVLEMVYPALETLTEPHRLIQSLTVLLGVLIPLVRDQPDAQGRSMRIHAITLLNQLLPGLDRNDIAKCMATYQLAGVLLNLVILVDCSDAIHLRDDLTEEERELCSATANFETIITMIIDRMFAMLHDCGQSASSSSGHGHGGGGGISTKENANIEDSILHRGTISVYRAICRNTGSALFKVAADLVYNFAVENVYDSKTCADAVADLIHVTVKCSPETQFARFMKLILERLANVMTPEVYVEEKVDFHVIWWLTMASRVVKTTGAMLVSNWQDVKRLLDLVMPLMKSSQAAEKTTKILDNVLEALTSVYLVVGANRRTQFDQPLEQYLPIRHWASHLDKKTFKPVWNVPTKESIACAEEIFKTHVMPHIEALRKPEGREKREILHRLLVIRHAVNGASFSLPLFEGADVSLADSPVHHWDEAALVRSAEMPEMTLDGRNIRQEIFECVKPLMHYLLRTTEDDYKSIHEAVHLLHQLISNRGLDKGQYQQMTQNYRVTKLALTDKVSGNKYNIDLLAEEFISLLHKKRIITKSGYIFKQQHMEFYDMLIDVSTSHYSQNRQRAQSVLQMALREHPYSYKKVLDRILGYLDPGSNATHEQLKGALYMLVDGRRAAIVLRMDYDSQLKIWPAIVRTRHSDKPSIIGLLDVAQNTIVENYESYRMKYEIPDAVREAVKGLLEVKEASSVNASRSYPSKQAIEENKDNIEKLYQRMKDGYYELADRLVTLAQDPSLHWRHVEMAHGMLSMLVRRDEPYPEEAARLFVRLLVHDVVKTRRIATAVMASWLRMNKPKAIKKNYPIPFMEPNTGPGAQWPIKYGIRDDNRCMIYEEASLPKTDEEWNRFQFCGKQHWGLYTWPKELRTYAPLGEQSNLCRSLEQLSPTEAYVAKTLMDAEFANRMRQLFSVEEKKDETFNAINFSLFYGLFRVFGDLMTPIFKEHLEALLQTKKESDEKLASEMVAGIVNGSKLWRWERQRHLWAWLGPLLARTFETVKEDGLRNWGVCVATICGNSEPRLLKPFLDLLFTLLTRPVENAFAASARLFLAQSAMCQFEWRGMELWAKLFELLKSSPVSQYANQRERIAVTFSSISWYDIPSLYVSPNLPDTLRPIKTSAVISLYDDLIMACWDELRLQASDGGQMPECDGKDGFVNGNAMDTTPDTEVKKASRLALKTLASYVFQVLGQSYVAFPPTIIKLVPLLCHYSNDVGDEELSRACSGVTSEVQSVLVTEENGQAVVDLFKQLTASACWWKTKVVMIRMMKIMVFANFFVFGHHRDEIGSVLVSLLSDCQIEVREEAAKALSGLTQSAFFEVTPQLIETFVSFTRSSSPLTRHGGVLGLAAIVLAFPYTVPTHLPDVLMSLCKFVSAAHPIRDTVKKALSEFKRTHQDSWREHQEQFTEDQLLVLRDLLVSPNYYV